MGAWHAVGAARAVEFGEFLALLQCLTDGGHLVGSEGPFAAGGCQVLDELWHGAHAGEGTGDMGVG